MNYQEAVEELGRHGGSPSILPGSGGASVLAVSTHPRTPMDTERLERGIDGNRGVAYDDSIMKTVEFETELRADKCLAIPDSIAASLPTRGKATVFVFVDMDPEDRAWRKASYSQFLRDEADEDAVYDKYR